MDDFKEQQMKYLVSYHGIHNVDDFNRNRRKIAELYERAALPIDKDNMALSNVGLISSTAFACSLAMSLKDLAKKFLTRLKLTKTGSLTKFHSTSL